MIIWPGPEATMFNRAALVIDELLLGLEIDGVQWRYTNLTGWFFGGGVRTAFEDYPHDHGAHDAPMYRSTRVIGVEGFIVAETSALGILACEQLAATMADGRMGTFAVADPEIGYREARVRMSAPPDGDHWNANKVNKFLLQFTAPDPRKYGTTVTEPGLLPTRGPAGLGFPLFEDLGVLDFGPAGDSGRVTLTNDGTADSDPWFELVGPHLGGVQLTEVESGASIAYHADIPADALLRLDARTGRATLNGAERTSELTRMDWWKVPAKRSSTVAITALGAIGQAGTWSANVKPAYW